MKFWVNESPLASELVTFREMGFGEALSGSDASYRMKFSLDKLSGPFQQKANDFINQCRLDDLSLAEADIPKLRELGYPPFHMLLKDDPELSSELIQDYLYFELFGYLFTGSPAGTTFVINNIESVRIQNSEIIICGKGFSKKPET